MRYAFELSQSTLTINPTGDTDATPIDNAATSNVNDRRRGLGPTAYIYFLVSGYWTSLLLNPTGKGDSSIKLDLSKVLPTLPDTYNAAAHAMQAWAAWRKERTIEDEGGFLHQWHWPPPLSPSPSITVYCTRQMIATASNLSFLNWWWGYYYYTIIGAVHHTRLPGPTINMRPSSSTLSTKQLPSKLNSKPREEIYYGKIHRNQYLISG